MKRNQYLYSIYKNLNEFVVHNISTNKSKTIKFNESEKNLKSCFLHVKDIYIDDLGNLYYYDKSKNRLECNTTGISYDIPANFIFYNKFVYYLLTNEEDFDDKNKNIPKSTIIELDLYTNERKLFFKLQNAEITDIKKNCIFYMGKPLFYTKNDIFFNNSNKTFSLEILKVRPILDGFLILDTSHTLHIVDTNKLNKKFSFKIEDKYNEIVTFENSMNIFIYSDKSGYFIDLNKQNTINSFTFDKEIKNVWFIDPTSIIFRGDEYFMYNFVDDELIKYPEEQYKFFYSEEINFSKKINDDVLCKECAGSTHENLINMFIDLKISMKKEMYSLKKEINELKELIDDIKMRIDK